MASKEGPPGCNLFIYHIPPSWTDDDLRKKFQGYGNMSLSQPSLPAFSTFHQLAHAAAKLPRIAS